MTLFFAVNDTALTSTRSPTIATASQTVGFTTEKPAGINFKLLLPLF